MKNKLPSLTAFCLFLVACAQPEKPPAVPAEKPVETAAPTATKAQFAVNCFENRLPDGSVVSFQYIEYYDEVVGILDYDHSSVEKHGAHGTFKGKKSDNIITATWSFVIEGSDETEEVMFKIESDKALKASGELENRDGVPSLKDPSEATWTETFTRVQCD